MVKKYLVLALLGFITSTGTILATDNRSINAKTIEQLNENGTQQQNEIITMKGLEEQIINRDNESQSQAQETDNSEQSNNNQPMNNNMNVNNMNLNNINNYNLQNNKKLSPLELAKYNEDMQTISSKYEGLRNEFLAFNDKVVNTLMQENWVFILNYQQSWQPMYEEFSIFTQKLQSSIEYKSESLKKLLNSITCEYNNIFVYLIFEIKKRYINNSSQLNNYQQRFTDLAKNIDDLFLKAKEEELKTRNAPEELKFKLASEKRKLETTDKYKDMDNKSIINEEDDDKDVEEDADEIDKFARRRRKSSFEIINKHYKLEIADSQEEKDSRINNSKADKTLKELKKSRSKSMSNIFGEGRNRTYWDIPNINNKKDIINSAEKTDSEDHNDIININLDNKNMKQQHLITTSLVGNSDTNSQKEQRPILIRTKFITKVKKTTNNIKNDEINVSKEFEEVEVQLNNLVKNIDNCEKFKRDDWEKWKQEIKTSEKQIQELLELQKKAVRQKVASDKHKILSQNGELIIKNSYNYQTNKQKIHDQHKIWNNKINEFLKNINSLNYNDVSMEEQFTTFFSYLSNLSKEILPNLPTRVYNKYKVKTNNGKKIITQGYIYHPKSQIQNNIDSYKKLLHERQFNKLPDIIRKIQNNLDDIEKQRQNNLLSVTDKLQKQNNVRLLARELLFQDAQLVISVLLKTDLNSDYPYKEQSVLPEYDTKKLNSIMEKIYSQEDEIINLDEFIKETANIINNKVDSLINAKSKNFSEIIEIMNAYIQNIDNQITETMFCKIIKAQIQLRELELIKNKYEEEYNNFKVNNEIGTNGNNDNIIKEKDINDNRELSIEELLDPAKYFSTLLFGNNSIIKFDEKNFHLLRLNLQKWLEKTSKLRKTLPDDRKELFDNFLKILRNLSDNQIDQLSKLYYLIHEWYYSAQQISNPDSTNVYEYSFNKILTGVYSPDLSWLFKYYRENNSIKLVNVNDLYNNYYIDEEIYKFTEMIQNLTSSNQYDDDQKDLEAKQYSLWFYVFAELVCDVYNGNTK